MSKFNPTITAYLVSYIIFNWVSILVKVEHISYIMGTRDFPDICTCPRVTYYIQCISYKRENA